ncbi:hypothetical protein AcW1_006559 [Taiwanofungus camphoratus]|nr:hypothetical protein AcW1_006559 [Antrodia cinnamomea]
MQPESAFECDDGYNRAVEEARTAVASHRGSQDALLDGYLDLAINLFSRFERFGRTEDAEESLFWERQALQLASDSHPDRPMFLNNLCVSLLTLHEAQKSKRLDSHKDYLSEAIDIGSSAIVAAGSHHPSLPLYHHTLSTAFITRYEDGQGCDSDLQEAIRLSQFAVQATADTPPDSWTATYRHGLSKALMQSYAHTEDLHDLDEAISLLRGAVKVEDLADIGRAPFHSSLAVALLRRYERRGILHDLEEGFELAGMAFEATPSDHPAFNKRRLNYCNALWLHYERFQELAYLDLAILYLYTATSECDLDPVTLQYSYLSLSVALVTRYEGARDKEDAEQAVNAARAANALVTTQNDVPIYLSNLGTTLLTLYECSDNVLHLEEALTCALRAVERRTQSREASETGRYFGSLSVCYYRRWQRLQQQEDLEQCVTFSRRAIDEEGALPHPLSAQWMVNLSRGLLELWSIRQCNESLINEAYELLRRVSTSYNFSSIVPHSVRFDAAERWATHASSCDRLMDALEAYRVAHNIIPQLIWIGKDTRTRNELLTRIAGLAADAAACAIAAQELKLAVEFLEQGRNVFWQQMFQLRTNLDPLRKVDADLADEVHAAAGLLGTIDQRVYIVPDSSSGLPPWISDNAERRRAARDWEQLLERVRQIEGFSDFLLPPCYDRLRLAASRGPVVLLNCSKMRCDALILLSPDDLVKRVPLGSITLETVGRMRQIMSGLARIAPSRLETPILDRKAQLGHTAVFSLNEMLSELQKAVVKPVLAEIESSVVDSRRIWWCPVGIFASLPIHGAMLYRGDQIHTNPESADDLDYVVSSYAPTLSLLVAESKASQKPPAILAIGVPASNHYPKETDGYSRGQRSDSGSRYRSIA